MSTTSDLSQLSEQDLEHALKCKRAARKAEVDERVRAIRVGEVEGDPLELFVEARYRCADNGTYLTKYRAIADAVAAHVGELVLVVQRREDTIFRGSPRRVPRANEYCIRKKLMLGLVGNPELVIDLSNDVCAVQLAREAVELRARGTPVVAKDLCLLGTGHLFDWGVTLNERMTGLKGRHHGNTLQFELVIGDDAVRQWFERADQPIPNDKQFTLRAMAALLEHPIQLPELDAYCEQRRPELLKELCDTVRFGQWQQGSGRHAAEQALDEAAKLGLNDDTPLVTIGMLRRALKKR